MSIIDTAHELLMKSNISYNKISIETGLNFNWLLRFDRNFKAGQDFHARKVEKLIEYLTRN